MIRSNALIALVVALGASACRGDERLSAASAVENVPLCYEWWATVASASLASSIASGYRSCLDSPAEAYDVGLQNLWDQCASEGNQEDCYDRGHVELYVEPESDDPSGPQDVRDTIAQFGYEATYARYVGGVNAVLAYLDSGNVRATDVEYSLMMMNGYTAALENLAEENVSAQLRQLVDTARATTERVTEMGEAVRGEEHARLVWRRVQIRQARKVINDYTTAIDTERAGFAALANDYRGFHDNEPATAAAIEELVEQANTSELNQIGRLQVEVMNLVVQENAAPQEVIMRAQRLAGFLDSKQEELERAVAPYREFMEEEGMTVPDLTSQTISDLERMIGYLEGRQQRFNAAGTKVLRQLRARREALVLLAMEAATRQTIADSARARAAADYLQTATARVASIWAAQPTVGGVELLAARYDGVLSLLQVNALCTSEDRPPWMADGCGIFDRERSRAQLYLSSSLRLKLLSDENRLRNAGGNPAMLDAMRAAVDRRDLAAAVFIHDEVAQSVEAG
jgi:hypothetical protein